MEMVLFVLAALAAIALIDQIRRSLARLTTARDRNDIDAHYRRTDVPEDRC